MTSIEWHADAAALRALVDGSADEVVSASIEAHVLKCDHCRGQVNALAFDDSLEQTWTAIRDRIEAPAPGLVERLLSRFGVSAESGRLLAAVPAMRTEWLLGVMSALVFAGLAAGFTADAGIGAFLLVAPLAPVAGVAAAFGGDADPSNELVITSPYSSARLLLIRTSAVVATCAPVAMLVGWFLPGPPWLTVAWLGPAAAGVGLTLVLARRFGLTGAAVVVGSAWATVCIGVAKVHEPLMLVDSTGQLIYLTVALLASAAIFATSRTFDLPGGPS